MNIRVSVVSLILCWGIAASAAAQIRAADPLDPFSVEEQTQQGDDDSGKSVDELILEGRILLDQERLIDARTKLLHALEKDPKRYEAHLLLAGYYLAHVGHYRLALRYAKQAEALFTEQAGPPPYSNMERRQEHAQILYLLSQIRLNLDDYPGALKLLDEFSAQQYYSSWYPGSRSWVLMKLGRLDEAITVARLGVLLGQEPGRTLNMLGILLSMKGERDSSLKIFRDSIAYELSLGSDGQPATPLNNSGEVYKETFQEDLAETAWLRAIRMPDGCEHVLPSLNLALLYIDQLNLDGAERTMNDFESCIAQYPLRNGEEHRSLVHLARGRIELYRGHLPAAIEHLDAALAERQWFGKIGTDLEDLEAGTLVSLARALRMRNNELAETPVAGFSEWYQREQERLANTLRAWWSGRRARQILIEQLQSFEDLYVRNTDSLLEYPTLGETLAELPARSLERRLAAEEQVDDRPLSGIYYRAYRAERSITADPSQEAFQEIRAIIEQLRAPHDNALKLHLQVLLLQHTDPQSAAYQQLAASIFHLNRPAILAEGLKLPVLVTGASSTLISELLDGPFLSVTDADAAYQVHVQEGSDGYELAFTATDGTIGTITARGADPKVVVNALIQAAFIEESKVRPQNG